MKNFVTYLHNYKTNRNNHWMFKLSSDNNYVFGVITHLDYLNLEEYNSNIVLYDESIDIPFIIL